MPDKTGPVIDAKDIVHNITVSVQFKHFHQMKLRGWIGSRLMLLGARITGCQLVYRDNNKASRLMAL